MVNQAARYLPNPQNETIFTSLYTHMCYLDATLSPSGRLSEGLSIPSRYLMPYTMPYEATKRFMHGESRVKVPTRHPK